jgi:hypothetical protein
MSEPKSSPASPSLPRSSPRRRPGPIPRMHLPAKLKKHSNEKKPKHFCMGFSLITSLTIADERAGSVDKIEALFKRVTPAKAGAHTVHAVAGKAQETTRRKKTPRISAWGFSLITSLTITYFHTGCSTIIGAKSFHGPVRDGKGWDRLAMVIRHNLYKQLFPTGQQRFESGRSIVLFGSVYQQHTTL